MVLSPQALLGNPDQHFRDTPHDGRLGSLHPMWDGSKVWFFVNAGEVGVPISVANATLQGTGGDTNTYLGAHPDGGETFGGLFDDLRIFDQALTMKELQSVFEFTDSQLIARYGEEYEYQIESIKADRIQRDRIASGLGD